MTGRPMNHPEHNEQVKFFKMLNYIAVDFPNADLAFAVPNGARVINIKHAKRMKAEGMKAGVPDIIYPVSRQSYHGLAIEMKSSEGRVSEKQSEYLKALIQQGWCVKVCRSARDAFEWFADYNQLDGFITDRVLNYFYPPEEDIFKKKTGGKLKIEPLYPNVQVQLSGEDGNSFSILSRVANALRKAGVPDGEVGKFIAEATAGDYDHLIQTCMKYANVE